MEIRHLRQSYGEVDIEAQEIGKHKFQTRNHSSRGTKDVSAIENKVLAMYARGSQQDISSTRIEDIYGFKGTK